MNNNKINTRHALYILVYTERRRRCSETSDIYNVRTIQTAQTVIRYNKWCHWHSRRQTHRLHIQISTKTSSASRPPRAPIRNPPHPQIPHPVLCAFAVERNPTSSTVPVSSQRAGSIPPFCHHPPSSTACRPLNDQTSFVWICPRIVVVDGDHVPRRFAVHFFVLSATSAVLV